MRQVLKLRPRDEIDGLVDGVLADPSRAEELKNVLRTRLYAVQEVAVPPAPEADDDLDLWENVPI